MDGGDNMSALKDPAIKLFGRTIPLPETHFPRNPHHKSDAAFQGSEKPDLMDMCSGIKQTEAENVHVEDSGNAEDSSVSDDGKEDQTLNKDDVQIDTKLKEDVVEASSASEEKILKRPDKVLPCPRCNSLETKFCYFNNYNVNQPRHFCRNCQRYWTAGGTMRNVPVGAGRRKNKQLATQYHQMLVSHDSLASTRDKIPDITSQHLHCSDESSTTLSPTARNEEVLKFKSENPLCESMGTISLVNQNKCVNLGSVRESKDDQLQCGLSMTTSSVCEVETHEQGNLSGSCNNFIPQHALQCFPVPQWASSWNSSWNSMPSVAGTSSVVPAQFSSELSYSSDGSKSNQTNWCSTPVMAVPGICAPNIPLQFLPAPYWGCLPVWSVGTGNIPLAGSSGNFSVSLPMSNSLSSNNFHTLGKHSRDGNSMDAEKSKKCVIVPKTLRGNDPDEASKSTVWETLGFISNQKESESRPSVFKPLENKVEGKDDQLNAAPVLEANPAAFCRSQTFQESS